MPESTKKSALQPRVFISYARADGQDFARELRTRLDGEQIPLWQDRVSLEGGRDWWLQIVDALDHVEFMIMVMTPAALQSPIVHKEWRTARQKGVCVYPVKGPFPIDFASLPRWMRDVHWYDLDYEWKKLLNDLQTRCEQPAVPFMVEELPEDFVERPQEFEALIGLLLDMQREEPVAITAALRGAGGYGKTTLARALCHDARIQEAFDDGILWVTLGEHPENLIGKVQDLIYMLSHERPDFTGMDAAMARLAELLADRDILLVIDDVWNAMHLKPFLHGGDRCARLITTRDDGVLPRLAQRIQVDAMQQDQAIRLLSAGLPIALPEMDEMKTLRQLVTRLGEWPLLITLVNGALRERINRGQHLADALMSINKTLEKRGLTAFDAQNAEDRNQAVTKTLGMSFDLLSTNDRLRYRELAIFPEDIDIPLGTVQQLWRATGGLDELDTEDVCDRLYRFSLLLRYDLATRMIRLHDVIRSYLQQDVGAPGLMSLHAQFLEVYGYNRWANLPPDEPYLWNHLAEHLLGAGRGEDLIATVQDGRYLTVKTHLRSVSLVEADVSRALKLVPTDSALLLLQRSLGQMSHLLTQCTTQREIAAVLYAGLSPLRELAALCTTLEQDLSRPLLTSWYALPQLRNVQLLRTLHGHSGAVCGCAVSPDGESIVSASSDTTLKVWDAHTGVERLMLSGDTDAVNGCAVSPDGESIVSASSDTTLKVWDAHSGTEQLTLRGHTDAVNGCAVSPDGESIVSASSDTTLKVWDAHTGVERLMLSGHTDAVNGCAVSPDGESIISASHDKTLKVWDAHMGTERLTLRGHTGAVWACVVSPDGESIVSASHDKTLKVWDAHSGTERLTLRGHTGAVWACAISPSGESIISASHDKTLKVWDAHSGTERLMLSGHTDAVNGCAVSPDGESIISASGDETLKVWDIHVEAQRLTLSGHTDWVWGCAVSPDGESIISASDDKTLKVWDAHSGVQRFTLSGHTDWVWGCAVSPDGESIISASDDKTLKVWDAHVGAERFTLSGHSGAVWACAVSPDGESIISASDDKTLKIWDAHSGAERLTLSGHTGAVRGCAVSPDGESIISASDDKTLKVWDAHSGTERLTLSGHTGAVRGCAVSPDGESIISASDDKTLKVWDAHSGACLDTFLAGGSLCGCAFCPDNNHIIAVGAEGVYFLQFLL